MPIINDSSLSAQLLAAEETFRSQLPKEAVQGIEATQAELAARHTPSPLKLGSVAPNFSLSNATGKKVVLADLLGSHTAVVVTWYRGGWCPYCNLTLRALTVANEDIIKLNAKLVCLTPETPDESMSTAEKNDLQFEVLSDDGSAVADKFGVAFEIGDGIQNLYKGFGMDLANMNGNEGKRTVKLPMPATFVLDRDGKVVYRFASLDYTKRAEPADVIAAIKSIDSKF